jgi:hypothetical protein
VGDVAFTSFAFPATGAPTPRTMPERLAEIKNVKDFGAKGDGGADDTAAIQAAVDWTSEASRGTIYFPLGTYKVSSPITYNYNGPLNITFKGEIGSIIFGTVAGFVFDRHLGTPDYSGGMIIFENISISNGSSSSTSGAIRMGSTAQGIVRECNLGGYICFTTEDSVGNSSKNVAIEGCAFGGTYHIIIGGGGKIHCCIMSGAHVAVTAYGAGLDIAGGRSERCDTSFLLGVDSGGNAVGLSGFSIGSTSTEGCWIAYDMAGPCSGFMMNVGGFSHDAGNSGATPDIQGGQYGLIIRADCARGGVISTGFSGPYDFAGVKIENATERADVVFRQANSINSGGPPGSLNWDFPTNAYTAQFINCNERPNWIYSQLPTGDNVREGDEFNITDSTTSTWGANVTVGGGGNDVLVRWNGSNWTVVGK